MVIRGIQKNQTDKIQESKVGLKQFEDIKRQIPPQIHSKEVLQVFIVILLLPRKYRK